MSVTTLGVPTPTAMGNLPPMESARSLTNVMVIDSIEERKANLDSIPEPKDYFESVTYDQKAMILSAGEKPGTRFSGQA